MLKTSLIKQKIALSILELLFHKKGKQTRDSTTDLDDFWSRLFSV